MKFIFFKGILGLWRGVEGQMLRVGTGSAVQLSTYDYVKRFLQSFQFFQEHRDALPFFASFITSKYRSIHRYFLSCQSPCNPRDPHVFHFFKFQNHFRDFLNDLLETIKNIFIRFRIRLYLIF